MVKHICNKCNKEFSSKSNLTQHLNRKTSCVKEIIRFICINCGQEFASNFNLQRHMNKKNKCKSKLEIEIELKIKLENEKHKNNLELEKEKRETIEAKKNAAIEIEKIRSERKERTTNIINVEIINNITNNVINNLNNTYNDNRIVYNSTGLEYIHSNKMISYDVDKVTDIYDKSKDAIEMSEHILKDHFNNDNHTETKCLFYDPETEKFYKKTKSGWKIVNYEKIDPVITHIVDEGLDKIKDAVEEPHSIDDEDYDKFQSIVILKRCLYKSPILKNTSIKALDKDNSIPYKDDSAMLKVLGLDIEI